MLDKKIRKLKSQRESLKQSLVAKASPSALQPLLSEHKHQKEEMIEDLKNV